MPMLIRFMLINFAVGATIGLGVATVLCLSNSGPFSVLGTQHDRLLAFFMLAMTLVPSCGLGYLGTALCLSLED